MEKTIIIYSGAGEKLQEFYEHYGISVTTEYTLKAEHCVVR